MATIRKRRGKWQVQIRRKGFPTLSGSFPKWSETQAWARDRESQADRGDSLQRKSLDTTTLIDVLVRYRDTVTVTKKGRVRETVAINLFLRHRLAQSALSDLTTPMVAAYVAERLTANKPASIHRELAIYRHVLEVARKAWGVPVAGNPFAEVPKPKVADARSRRLQPGEWERLELACRQSRNPFIRDLVEFGLETAMRRGEVLATRWSDVNFEQRTLHIREAKNGDSRTIPLSRRAVMILTARRSEDQHPEDRIFPTSEDAVKTAWRRVMGRVRLQNFRYHDLRHEAVSRFFELGLSVPEVALISGHRDPRMLFRYTHPRPEVIAEKLAELDDSPGREEVGAVQEREQ